MSSPRNPDRSAHKHTSPKADALAEVHECPFTEGQSIDVEWREVGNWLPAIFVDSINSTDRPWRGQISFNGRTVSDIAPECIRAATPQPAKAAQGPPEPSVYSHELAAVVAELERVKQQHSNTLRQRNDRIESLKQQRDELQLQLEASQAALTDVMSELTEARAAIAAEEGRAS